MNAQLLREINALHAELCSAVADPTRIALLYALREGASTVGQLAGALDQPQTTVSRHLKILREAGLVGARRDGMNVYYALTDDKVLQALDMLRQVLNERLNRSVKLAKAIG